MGNQMTSRRELLFRIFPACSLCLGIPQFALSGTFAQATQSLSIDKRATEKTDMSYLDLFSFSYSKYIPVFKNLRNQVGKEKFLEMLEKATYESAFQGSEASIKQEPNTAGCFCGRGRGRKGYLLEGSGWNRNGETSSFNVRGGRPPVVLGRQYWENPGDN